MNDIKNITCAVIVTFNPDMGFKERLLRIKKQFPLVIIVDNGSEKNVQDLLVGELKKVILLNNDNNLGIATALNQGVKKATDLNYESVVTFDQDSVIENNLLAVLSEVYIEIDNPMVIIGSNYWNTNKKGAFLNCKNSDVKFIERKTVITSGMFFHVSLIKKIGDFKDAYFIDSVDHEFCLRARDNQCKIYISCKPLMKHSIGEVKTENRLMESLVFSHSPIRVYYMARNTTVTIKKFIFKEPVWGMCQLLRLSVEFLAIVLTKEDRTQKVPAFIQGLVDGTLGRLGKQKKYE